MVAEFIFFAAPVFIAVFNARLHRADENGRRSGLASFYKTVGVLSALNFAYFCYSLFTYYPSCGSGRHGCSMWKDFTVNVPSQLRFWDYLFSWILVCAFFMREQSRNPKAPNAWQYISYSLFGSVPFALATNFAARLRMNDEIALQQREKRKIVERLEESLQARSRIRYDLASSMPRQPAPSRRTQSYHNPRPLTEQERRNVDAQWNAELSANSLAIIVYTLVAALSLSVWVPNIGSVLANYLDFYSNYCNRFVAHALLLMWTSLATRIIALSDISILRVVFLVLPLFSVSTAFSLFLLSREMARDRGNREEYKRIVLQGVDKTTESLLLGALSGDFSSLDADSIGTFMPAVAKSIDVKRIINVDEDELEDDVDDAGSDTPLRFSGRSEPMTSSPGIPRSVPKPSLSTNAKKK